MAQVLGTTAQLQIEIPEAGDTNWATSIKDDCFTRIAEHTHQGGTSKTGSKLNASLAIDSSTSWILNDTFIIGTDNAGTGTVNILKVDTSDTITFGAAINAVALSSPVLTTPEINDTSADHQYVFAVSELAADRTVTLPLLTGNDEFVFKDHAVTLTNKTIDSDNNTITNIVNADIKAAAAIAVNKLAALTASEIVISDGSGFLTSAAVATYPSLTELTYVKGVTSAIQTQIDTKATNPMTTAGDIIYSSDGSGTPARLGVGSNGEVLTLAAGVPSWAAVSVTPTAVTNKTTTYTALTTDATILADTSGGGWTLTLYAASGNDGAELTVVKTTTDANVLTIDGNASETIDGATTIDLDRGYQSVQLVCDGSNWHVKSGRHRVDSCVYVHTGNGHGSTNTKIRRFTTTTINQGDAITYADSATLGATFTVNEDGIYAISYGDNFSSAAQFGITLNSSELTTGIAAVTTDADVLMMVYCNGNTVPDGAAWIGYLEKADVIRAHTSGTSDSGSLERCNFAISKIGRV